MNQTIAQLKESKNWLEKAIESMEKGTIESLLEYFQIGYTSGTWHLPSIATKNSHEAEEKLALLLNEKIKHSGFFIDHKRAKRNGEFVLYYNQDYISVINLHHRRIYGSTDFQHIASQIIETKEKIEKEITRCKNTQEISKRWLQEYKSSISYLVLGSNKQARYHSRKLETLEVIIEEFEKELKEKILPLKSKAHKYMEIAQQLIQLRKILIPYGFTFEGALKEGEEKTIKC